MDVFGINQTVFTIGAILICVLLSVVIITIRLKLSKMKKPMSPVEKVLVTIVFVISMSVFLFNSFSGLEDKVYYDSQGKFHLALYNVVYYDEFGNTYEYDFDSYGYDYLFKNGSDEKYDSRLCFVDENGLFFYDEFMEITAVDRSKCTDGNGKIYYHAIAARFDKNGKISDGSSVLFYGKDGTAYPYKPVPYVDKDGNKYNYSFDSAAQKGYNTNVKTKEKFDNDYSFVDEDGYFVYDKNHSFVKQKNAEYNNQYVDNDGNIYYWASGITWDEQGRLHDSLDRVIEK